MTHPLRTPALALRCLALVGLLGVLSPGCGSDAGDDTAATVALTDEVTLVAVKPRLSASDALNPSVPEHRQAMLDGGLSEIEVGPGEPHVARVLGGGDVPDGAPFPALVARLVHFADAQITDDESPARLATFDQAGATASAFRPQDAYLCHLANAMVQTFGALHRQRPIDLVLVGGDNIDNAQQNELDWWLALLGPGGESLSCDSGADDDPVPGPDNDPKDELVTRGLGNIPWLWVTGNHDRLVQGNFVVDEQRTATATGSRADTGTRDWREPGGPVVTGEVPADANRKLMSGRELLTRVIADGDGHGLSDEQAATGQAFYSSDIIGTDLRIIVLDTSAPSGGASGVLKRADVDTLVVPMLDDALAAGRTVILAAHHAAGSLSDGSDFGGEAQDDALTEAEFIELITSYPNIVVSLVAHSHQHRVRELVGPNGARLFEVTTAALADFPHQSRLVEIYEEGVDWLRIRLTCIDADTSRSAVAAEGYALGVLDWVSGWADANLSEPEDRNVDLWIAR